jgi:hypothetical protein
MNRSIVRSAAVSLTCAVLAGCATIAGGGTSQPVTINSEPSGATFVVKSSSGIVMSQGKAPQTIKLPRKNEYQIEISSAGYQPQLFALTKSINGWVWGNLLIGWIPGFIVDFAGGAANKLEPALVQVNLTRSTSDASSALEGTVRFLSESGRLVAEKHIRLEPIPAGSAER